MAVVSQPPFINEELNPRQFYICFMGLSIDFLYNYIVKILRKCRNQRYNLKKIRHRKAVPDIWCG